MMDYDCIHQSMTILSVFVEDRASTQPLCSQAIHTFAREPPKLHQAQPLLGQCHRFVVMIVHTITAR